MGIELFQHNQEAYHAARKMLAEKGLAAVVHPTGTGKSFVALECTQRYSCWDRPLPVLRYLDPWRNVAE